jgi:ComF family protein
VIQLPTLLRSLLSVIAPRLCVGCRAPLRSEVALEPSACPVRGALRPALCAPCRSALATIGPGACRACGRPRQPFAPALGERCGRCAREPRGGVRSTITAFRYTGAGRDLLRTLKYHGRRELALPLGRALAARVAAELPDLVGACGVALVTAVPLHWTRLLRRGYNQAELIARVAARELGLPFAPRALTRTKRTKALFSVPRGDREEALAGALASRGNVVRGRWVLLVDDIRTTGATLATCGRALRAAGAARVDAAVLGR